MNQFDDYLKSYEQSKPKENGQSVSIIDKEIPFPVDAFPPDYANIISKASSILKTETSHLGTAMIGAVSLATGNTTRVQAGNHNSPIPATLWMILVEASGGGKGRAQRFGFRPLEAYAEQQRVKISNDKYRLENAIKEARIQMYSATDADSKKKLESEKREMERNLDSLEDYYLIINDITMEAVRTANLKNRRGIGIVRDEISGWYNSFGKYSKGGNASSEESFYIETYDGAPLLPFRAGSKGVTCDYPFTPIFGGTQPDTLGDLGRNNRMVSGFVFRLLFSYPHEKQLSRRSVSDYQVDNKINDYITQYEMLLGKIMNDLDMEYQDEAEFIPKPHVVTFNEQALRAYVDWYNTEAADFSNRLNADEKTKRVIKSIVTRSDMSMLRLCLIMEIMKWSIGESSLEHITKDSVERAARLMEYYRYTMLKVYMEVEKIRFETGHVRARKTQIEYKKLFGKRTELSRNELIQRIKDNHGLTELTAEKYMLEDCKQPVPPITVRKEKTSKFYQLNHLKS